MPAPTFLDSGGFGATGLLFIANATLTESGYSCRNTIRFSDMLCELRHRAFPPANARLIFLKATKEDGLKAM
jgi:hypothetical protein